MNESYEQGPAPATCITDGVHTYLRQTKPWVLLAAIMTFVTVGFMLLIGLGAAGVGFIASRGEGSPSGALGGIFVSLVYVVLAIVYLFPGLFLARYASAIGRVLHDRSPASLEEALKHQRSFWRYVGVLMLVGLVIMILGVGAAILIPAFIRASQAGV